MDQRTSYTAIHFNVTIFIVPSQNTHNKLWKPDVIENWITVVPLISSQIVLHKTPYSHSKLPSKCAVIFASFRMARKHSNFNIYRVELLNAFVRLCLFMLHTAITLHQIYQISVVHKVNYSPLPPLYKIPDRPRASVRKIIRQFILFIDIKFCYLCTWLAMNAVWGLIDQKVAR